MRRDVGDRSVEMDAGHPGTRYAIDPTTLRPVAVDPAAMEHSAASLEAGFARLTARDARASLATRAALLFAVAGAHERAAALLARASSEIDEVEATRSGVADRIRVAQVWQLGGRLQEAASLLHVVVERCRREGPCAPLLDFALQHRGKVLFDLGDLIASEACFVEALSLREIKRDPELIASTQWAIEALRRRTCSQALERNR